MLLDGTGAGRLAARPGYRRRLVPEDQRRAVVRERSRVARVDVLAHRLALMFFVYIRSGSISEPPSAAAMLQTAKPWPPAHAAFSTSPRMTPVSWHAIRSAAGSKWWYEAADRSPNGISMMSMPSHWAVRRRAVDDQAVVGRIGTAARGVRAARQVDELLDVRLLWVADVDDVQALFPGHADARVRTASRPAGMPFADAESQERVMMSP